MAKHCKARPFTNTGDIDLKDLTVTDPMLGVEDVNCLAEGEVLPVGESVDCVHNAAYTYKVTDEDVKAGKVHNLATGNIPGLPGGEGETTTPVLTLPNTGGSAGLIYLSLGSVGAAATGLTFARARKAKEVVG